MAHSALPPYPQIPIYTGDDSAVNEWIEGFTILMRASLITDKKHQRSLLLHYMGPCARRIVKTIHDVGNDDEPQKLIDALYKAFAPKPNPTVQRHLFRRASQTATESVDAFQARLQTMASKCDFHDVDREVCDQIINTCTSQKLRLKGLQGNLSLSDLLTLARSMEAAQTNAAVISQQPSHVQSAQYVAEDVNPLISKYQTHPRPAPLRHTPMLSSYAPVQQPRPSFQPTTQPRSQPTPSAPLAIDRRIPNNPDGSCNYCGRRHDRAQRCPARGTTCTFCGIINHHAYM
jgi:hypothetical protein